ncbi:hypothetical protein [Pelagibacterium sp.]|uniref:hypothetical protein n=1 Tax=Pelagibacterium sp. TaxID=1967288 RepID=UPI003A8ECDC1
MLILFTLVVFLLAFGGLALGVLAGRPPIKGSCGGLDCIEGIECGVCRRKSGRKAP